MRRSPLSEHKVDLREFADTPEGALVIQHVAHTLGVPPEELHSMIQGLPPTDFYAPFRQHRLRWQGGGEVVVAAFGGSHSEDLIAYDVNGTGLRIQRSRGVPHRVLLLLRPAEVRGVRIKSSPEQQSAAIQEPVESDLGIVTTQSDPCDVYLRVDTCSETVGGPGAPADTTRVVSIGISSHYDEWWDETNEIIVEGGIYQPQTGDDPCVACNRRVYTGVRPNETFYPSAVIFVNARVDPALSQYLFFNFREEDSYVQDDQIGHTYRSGIPLYNQVDTSINNNGTPTKIYRWTPHEFYHASGEVVFYSGNENGQITAQWTPR